MPNTNGGIFGKIYQVSVIVERERTFRIRDAHATCDTSINIIRRTLLLMYLVHHDKRMLAVSREPDTKLNGRRVMTRRSARSTFFISRLEKCREERC